MNQRNQKSKRLTKGVIDLEPLFTSPVIVLLFRLQNPAIFATNVEVFVSMRERKKTSKENQEKAERILRFHIERLYVKKLRRRAKTNMILCYMSWYIEAKKEYAKKLQRKLPNPKILVFASWRLFGFLLRRKKRVENWS